MTPAMQPAGQVLIFVTAEVPSSAAPLVDWLTILQKSLDSQPGGDSLDPFSRSLFCTFVGTARLDKLGILEPFGLMAHIRRFLMRMATP